MSANIDLVRSIYADWGRGDFQRRAWVSDDVELLAVDGPNPGAFKGLTGLAEWVRETLDAWEGFRGEAEEYYELEDGRVLVLSRRLGRGRSSGFDLASIRSRSAMVFELRDRRISKLTVYWDRNRALADLDLEA